MDQWGWVAVRAYAPVAFMLLAAMVADAVLSDWQASPALAGLLSVVRWARLLMVVTALVLLVIPTCRLLQWRRGAGTDCPHCGGALGRERAGYARMGGAYRRCYSCGNNVNHRYYE